MPRPEPVKKKLPGKARPREEALREYEEYVQSIKPEFRFLYAPPPERAYRWRLELECGHIVEQCSLTFGSRLANEHPPLSGWLDPLTTTRLPDGQAWCSEHRRRGAPYRRVEEWVRSRNITFPADGPDPPDWLRGDPDNIWPSLRRTEPKTYADWLVRLTCGHHAQVFTDPAWKPKDGPSYVTEKRAAKMRAEMEEHLADQKRRTRLDRHHLRMIEERWPQPFTEHECPACPRAKAIVAYEGVGWLRQPPKPPAPPKPASRETLERRAKLAEQRAAKAAGEAQRYRDQLRSMPKEK